MPAHRIGFLLSVAAFCAGSALAADKPAYNRDIRPILAENCFPCHGPDSASRKADLRLDQRDAAVKAGAITPGKPEESELINRVFSEDASDMMPPRASHKVLSAEQKEQLKQWIAAGAEYQPHWSFIAPARPQPPAVKNAAWARNPIDNFVLAKLEERGLAPAPEADRRTLARRLSLDVTGLPPTPAEVEAFAADAAPDAYERYVDRLLQSKRWGEHRGRYWLDAARYADTHGIHFDNYREMWAYRDWVIHAFNRNQPFDQFTIEQLAGDLLPNPSLDQQVATGFNRCNITTNEGGVIPEEYAVLYTRDRTETTARVWMGLTAGCAVCHDHKFDPLPQKEFYSMSAFFNNTTQAVMDGNIKDTPPVLFVPLAEDRARWAALDQEIAEAKQKLEARRQAARVDFEKWLAAAKPETLADRLPREGLLLHAPLSEGQGNAAQATVDGKARQIAAADALTWNAGHVAAQALETRAQGTLELADAGDFENNQAFSVAAWVRFSEKSPTGAILSRMDDQSAFRGWDFWLENGRVGAHIINKWPENALKVVSNTAAKPNEWNHWLVSYDGSRQAAGVKVYLNGQAQPTTPQANSLTETIRTAVPLKIGQRSTASRLENLLLQDLRVYGRAVTPSEAEQLARATRAMALVQKPAAARSPAETNELFEWWLKSMDPATAELAAKPAALEQEKAAIRARGTVAHVTQERKEPPTAFLLFRGEYDQRRDQIPAATPAFLPPMTEQEARNRLGFAQWLLRPEHPLMARVTVNRFWQELFGTGIVRTSEDFGITGELPSHPELLDWLALEFRESGWDVKKFFRLMLTSATYRQSAAATAEKLEKDPQNRLLSRGPRFRMDAEMVRDYALAAAGLLVEKIGGPSVRPYQPEGVWEAVAMPESNTRFYKPDSGESLYRRSLYTFWKRAAPPASLDVLNAPNRETCVVRRERTNTPLQALVTLNDPQFVEAARNLAQAVLKEGGPTPETRMDYAARRVLARPLRPEESQLLSATFNDLLRYYQAHADGAKALVAVGESKADPALDAATLAAWTMLANTMMNLDEVLNK